MYLAPRIRLRTIFLLFFCAAAGLTCAVAPPPPEDPTFAGLIYLPQLKWQIGLMSAASVMIVVGLFQQMRQLARMSSLDETQDNNISFARLYGITWRAVVAFTITAVVIVQMLVSRRIFELPEHRDLLLFNVFPDQLWVFCFIIVLSNSTTRWKYPTSQTLEVRWRWVAAWGAGTVLALILLPDQALIMFLVHIATAGIEAAIPLSQQRAGSFPNHASEGFRVIWTCLGAVVIVVLAAMALMSTSPVDTRGRRFLKTGILFALLSLTFAFCIWYYWVEFYRISPDLAGAGFPGNWLDWSGASLLAAFTVSVGSYRQARGKHTSRVVEYAANESDKISLHETFTCQLLIVAAALWFIIEAVRSLFSQASAFGTISFADLRYIVCDPSTILYAAMGMLSLQLLWVWWRRRNDTLIWDLSELDRPRYFLNWLAMAALVVVAIPTFSAYCFVFWLGPWYQIGN